MLPAMRALPPDSHAIARKQHGLLTTRSLAAAGFQRREIELRIARGDWQRLSARVIAMHSQPCDRMASLWAAALHYELCGLAGASVLELHGMPAPHDLRIHLVGPPAGRGAPLPGVILHTSEHCEVSGSPAATRLALAVLQALRWARSDRQAAFQATWAIQRRLVTLDDLLATDAALLKSPGTATMRRRLHMLEPGIQSINELDFAKACRSRGLPEPLRQTPRKDSQGVWRYVDVEFRVSDRVLIVEIDGMHHLDFAVHIDDQWRANELSLQGATVLRIPALALRLAPEMFFEQIARWLESRRAAA